MPNPFNRDEWERAREEALAVEPQPTEHVDSEQFEKKEGE